jgi:hypothetical protein
MSVETPAQTCRRILAALEDFAAQETTALAAGDFATLAALAHRAAPLVEHLAQHGPGLADENFRARIAALLERRRQNDDTLSVHLAHAKAELKRANESQRRVAQIASIYGSTGTATRQLSAVG